MTKQTSLDVYFPSKLQLFILLEPRNIDGIGKNRRTRKTV